MKVNRQIPALEAGEREMLSSWLEFQRDTLAVKCEGLTDEQLREQAVPPSSLSLLGLVRHMAEGERQWFRMVLGRQELDYRYYTDDDPGADAEFDVENGDVAEASAGPAAARGAGDQGHVRGPPGVRVVTPALGAKR
jgi:hypothetical protein